MRLVKDLFGSEFKPQGHLFGLTCGQIRPDDFVHNGGWYNVLGEKMGWGDLSRTDMKRISEELREDELFVVLSESASFWKFVDMAREQESVLGHITESGWFHNIHPSIFAPGVKYVCDHAMYIIAKGVVYLVTDQNWDDIRGFSIKCIKKNDAAELIVKHANLTGGSKAEEANRSTE